MLQKRSHYTASRDLSKSTSVSTLNTASSASAPPTGLSHAYVITRHAQPLSHAGASAICSACNEWGSGSKLHCSAVVDDLLFAFMGLDGKYVRATKVVQPDGVHISYRLHTQANPALRELSTRMLALWYACGSHATIPAAAIPPRAVPSVQDGCAQTGRHMLASVACGT